ncbi:MAG: GNAT family N-acetyltransferase [Pseudomonadota bacterium]
MSRLNSLAERDYRFATPDDVPALVSLIERSALALQRNDYTVEQIRGALGTVFGVDTQLINDRTYFSVYEDARLIACGGWSKRQTLFGADAAKSEADPLLNPDTDPARIRAFFVHPDFARQGIGNQLIALCEDAARAEGFTRMALVATLSGERLYAAKGYVPERRYVLSLDNGETMPVVSMGRTLA